MSAFLVIIQAIGQALEAAFGSYQQDQDVEKALIAGEEALAKARAEQKFGPK